MEDSQLTPFFSSTFSALFITFLYLKIAKIHFLVIPPLVHVDLKKYLNFGQKLLIRTAHHTLLESRHPQVTKNPYYILAPVVGQKKGISFWTRSRKHHFERASNCQKLSETQEWVFKFRK